MDSNFQKDYEFAQTLHSRGQAGEIARLVSPENLEQIMKLLTVEIAEPSAVSLETDYEELPTIKVEDAPHWPRYFEYLRTMENPWNNRSLKSLDISTQKVLEKIPRSTKDTFDSTGLVVGHVQAGKTANYTGLIAKAADQGYNLFIIFTGTTNKLREQTQNRLAKQLFGDVPGFVSKPPLEHRWKTYTTLEEDGDFSFNLPPEHLIGTNPCIIIAKKFHTVLDKIVDFLETTDSEILDSKKLLLVDDEADYASINTLGETDNDNEEVSDETKSATKTNEALRRIRNFFKSNAYVGYTATPFANVLIDPHYIDDDLGKTLYPRDFIISLPQPEGYLGGDSFFPDLDPSEEEADKLCIVPPGEAEIMREGGSSNSDNSGLPDSFLLAFTDFLLTGAAKSLRLQGPHSNLGNPHHTMLVQTHHEIETHELTQKRIAAEWELWKNDLIVNSDRSWLLVEFEKRWKSEFSACPEKWDKLSEVICSPKWLRKVEIMTVNRNSPTRLDYDDDRPLMVVVIGGFSLGRGLTLEGLTTSFFARTTKFYDTLLQMGRWFGFRKGYEDLVRVHLTAERYSCFRHLAIVEKEIRFDIARYDNLGCTPMELSVRIQEHHTMEVTNSMKRRNVRKIQKGWSASSVQTFNFDFARTANLNHNLSKTDIFLKGLGENFTKKGGNYVWENTDSRQIMEFISDFKFGKNASNFDAKEIIKYIEKVNSKDEPELTQWSVALAGKNSGSPVPFGPGPIVPVERSRFLGTDDIGALADSNHWTLDLPGTFDDYTNEKGNYDKARMLERRSGAEASGLLLIYVIDKDSKPRNSKIRGELFQDDEEPVYVVGLAIAFPESPSEIAGRTYISNLGVSRYD